MALVGSKSRQAEDFVGLLAPVPEWPVGGPPKLIHATWPVHLTPSAIEGGHPVTQWGCHRFIEAREALSSLQSQVSGCEPARHSENCHVRLNNDAVAGLLACGM